MTHTLSFDSQEEVQVPSAAIFGQRMKAARELCGLSQIEAFPLFGYANSAQLCKVENAFPRGFRFNAYLIAMAVKHYGVSADYLLGFSGHHQRDIRSIRESKVRDIVADYMADEFAEIRRLAKALGTIADLLEQYEKKTAEMMKTLVRFRELNPEFEDMPGGAKLDRLAQELRLEAKQNADRLTAVRESLQSPR